MSLIKYKPYNDPDDPEKHRMMTIQRGHALKHLQGKDLCDDFVLINDAKPGRTSSMFRELGFQPNNIHIIEKDSSIHKIHQLRGYGSSNCDMIKCVKNTKYEEGDYYTCIICDIEISFVRGIPLVRNIIKNGFVGSGSYLNVTIAKRSGAKGKKFKNQFAEFRDMVDEELKKKGLRCVKQGDVSYGNARMGRAHMIMLWMFIKPMAPRKRKKTDYEFNSKRDKK